MSRTEKNRGLIVWLKVHWPKGLLLLLALLLFVRTAWMCDDGFISFTSAANLVEGKGFTFQSGERLQTFSNPLWTMLGALVYAFTNEVWITGMMMGICISLLAFGLLFGTANPSKPKVLLLGILALLSSAFIDFSTSGLENSLSHLLILIFSLQFLKDRRDAKWLRNLAGLAALLMLNRPDLIIVAGPACLFAFFVTEKKGKWKAVWIGLLPILLWEVFSLTYYGFLLPNTWYAKLGVADGRLLLIEKGFVYFWNCLRRDPVTKMIWRS